MPAQGRGANPTRGIQQRNASLRAKAKPAPKPVVFKPAQVSTPVKRLTHTLSTISKAEHEKAAKKHERALGKKVFGQSLGSATEENYETGGRMRQYAAEHPKPEHRSFFGTIGHGLSEGEHAVEGGIQSTLKFLGARPGGLSNTATMNESELEGQRKAASQVITAAGETVLAGSAARLATGGLKAGARGLATARAGKLAERGLAEREALRETSGVAAKGTTAQRLGELQRLSRGEQVATPGSRALGFGSRATQKGGNLAVVAIPGKRLQGPHSPALVKELGALATAPLQAGIAGGKAAVGLAQGHPAEAERLLKGLSSGAVGEAAQGNFSKAIAEAKASPLFSAAEVAGLEAFAGRATGAGLRAVGTTPEVEGLRGAAARAGSTVAPPLAGSNEAGTARKGYVRQRERSKDTFRKGAEVAAEKVHAKLPGEARKPLTVPSAEHAAARHEAQKALESAVDTRNALRTRLSERSRVRGKPANGTEALNLERSNAKVEEARARLHDIVSKPAPETPVTRSERGRTVPVLKASEHEMERFQKNRANLESARTQAKEHVERHEAQQIINKIEGRKGRLATWVAPQRASDAIVRLAAGGTIKHLGTWKEDVSKYVSRVQELIDRQEKGERIYGSKNELAQAKHNVEMLSKALDNSNVNWGALIQKGIEYGRASREGDVRLKEHGIFDPQELEHGALSEYALSHMGARHGVNSAGQEGLLSPSGKLLSVREIEAHARENGRAPETIGYFPHAVATNKPSAYHLPLQPGLRPTSPGYTRKGIIHERGAMDLSKEAVQNELVRKKVTANNAEATDQFIREAGATRPDGQFFTAKEGGLAARRLSEDTGRDWTAVRASAAKGSPEMKAAISKAQDPGALETIHHQMLNDRIITDPHSADQARNVVLVPTDHVRTLLQHMQSPGELAKFAQIATNSFRLAVLPQPRWLAGNFFEPYFVRLPVYGSGAVLPGGALDFTAAEAVVRHLENSGDADMVKAAGQVRAMMKAGLFIGRTGANTFRNWKMFSGRTAKLLYGAHVVRNLPVVKHTTDLAMTVPKSIFALNHVIESTAQGMALGRSIRNDVHAFSGSWLKTLKLGQEAAKQAAEGLVETATQHRYMEQQYEMLGQYQGFSPNVRKIIGNAAPFLPWTANSLRFTFWTLPAHHTAKFAAMANLSNQVLAEWQAEHKDLPPGELQYAIKRKDGGMVNVARYTPFAAAVAVTEGDYQNFTNLAFAQISGSLEALRGKTPYGKELEAPRTKANPKGKVSGAQRVEIFLRGLFESSAGLAGSAARYTRGFESAGGTAYDTSMPWAPQTKPGTSHQAAANRLFNPFAPTYLKQPKRAKKAPTSRDEAVSEREGGGVLSDEPVG